MQTSKILLALGVTLLYSLSGTAQDNDAQAKARQALEQQLNQSRSAPTQPPSPAPPPAKEAPAAPPMAAPAAPPAALPPPATSANDQEIAKARDAMRQKINDLAPTPPPPAAAPAAAAAAAPVAAAAAEPPPKVVPPPATEPNSITGSETGASPEAIEKARTAMRQKVTELPSEQPEPGSANDAAIAKAREAMYDKMQKLPPDTSGESFGQTSQQFPPLESPELPISGAKVQKLHALLQQYKADQITPEQYQAERAKILAAP
jgi:hypothetical protein